MLLCCHSAELDWGGGLGLGWGEVVEGLRVEVELMFAMCSRGSLFPNEPLTQAGTEPLFMWSVSKSKRCSKGQPGPPPPALPTPKHHPSPPSPTCRVKNDPDSGRTCCRDTTVGLAPATSALSQICPGALALKPPPPPPRPSLALH